MLVSRLLRSTRPARLRPWARWPLALLALAACRGGFIPATFQGTNEQLFQATLREYEQRRWDNALAGFELLVQRLPARDTLFPRVLMYQGRAHQRKEEFLLAAQSFTRLAETFPTDSLADDALLEAGRSYGRLWRKPQLDATYGESALGTYRTMLALFPESPLAAEAQREIARLDEWFALKNYEAGLHYFRRKAYFSGLIYFQSVIDRYPNTQTVKDAMLRTAESYRAVKFREQQKDVCTVLWQSYPADREVREACGPAPATAATPRTPTTPPANPPATPPSPPPRPGTR